MRQTRTHPGLGGLQLVLGFLILFGIRQQVRALAHNTCRGNNIIKSNCTLGFYPLDDGMGCVYNSCYKGLDEMCDQERHKCIEELTCSCGKCMNCQDGNCNSTLGSCSMAKRLNVRLPHWYHRYRWNKLAEQ
ncbi:uncharacterized protein LOC108602658 isoform X2 [Drosophila busckii]|uniref:uncharacterized protein LOC108602658 isoform X2 n=1 Tax=Drosophila busckii TaxID=30019 RepID=UPI00083F476E|nr:uncharacterized protein LOC108602658 isoform X2 [Drosophila busckii]